MTATIKPMLVQEIVGGEIYEYYPLGDYIVRAKGVCGGRPTFKYTRLEVSFILSRVAMGRTIDEIVQAYDDPHLTREAIQEAMSLANAAFVASPQVTQPLAA